MCDVFHVDAQLESHAEKPATNISALIGALDLRNFLGSQVLSEQALPSTADPRGTPTRKRSPGRTKD